MGKIEKIVKQTDNRFLNMYELQYRDRTGREKKYYTASRAEKEEELKIRTRKDTADGVAIYALCGEKKDHVVLIRQFRYPLDDYVYELPAGLVDEGETFREAAVREMHEETGLTLTPVQADPIFEKPRYTTIGLTDEACATVYGYAEGNISKEFCEPSEEIEVVLADRQEVRRILREERVALICAYHLMHFLYDKKPFAFLEATGSGPDGPSHFLTE